MDESQKLLRAARDLVAGYKLSGMNNPEIAGLLALALAELGLDPESPKELIKMIVGALKWD